LENLLEGRAASVNPFDAMSFKNSAELD
jgi:hypothetical protein